MNFVIKKIFSEILKKYLFFYTYLYKKIIFFLIKKPIYFNRHLNRNFLIIAGGPSVKKYQKEILNFIRNKSCVVISVNKFPEFVISDYHVFTNMKRFVQYVDGVDNNTKLLIGPYISIFLIKRKLKKKYESIMYLNKQNNFDIKNGIIQTDCRTSPILATGISIVMGAKNVYIAGIDGYQNLLSYKEPINYYDDSKKTEEAQINYYNALQEKNEVYLGQVNQYLIRNFNTKLKIITPTEHLKYFDQNELKNS